MELSYMLSNYSVLEYSWCGYAILIIIKNTIVHVILALTYVEKYLLILSLCLKYIDFRELSTLQSNEL